MSKENKDHIPEVKNMVDLKGEVSVILSEEYSNEFQVYFGESGISFKQQGKVGQIIADALNTIQKCNVMPSKMYELFIDASTKNDLQAEKIIELQKQRDELLEFVEEYFNEWKNINQKYIPKLALKAQELIKKYKP